MSDNGRLDGKLDKAKGRLKEAGGAISGDSKLKNEGRVEQAKGSAKKLVDKVADKLGSTDSSRR